jgi:hypothetical protein
MRVSTIRLLGIVAMKKAWKLGKRARATDEHEAIIHMTQIAVGKSDSSVSGLNGIANEMTRRCQNTL